MFVATRKNGIRNQSHELDTEQKMKKKQEKRAKRAQLPLVYCFLKAQALIYSRYETISANIFLQNYKINNSCCTGADYKFCLWKLQLILRSFWLSWCPLSWTMPYGKEVEKWPLLVFATLSSCWSGQVDCPKDVNPLASLKTQQQQNGCTEFLQGSKEA